MQKPSGGKGPESQGSVSSSFLRIKWPVGYFLSMNFFDPHPRFTESGSREESPRKQVNTVIRNIWETLPIKNYQWHLDQRVVKEMGTECKEYWVVWLVFHSTHFGGVHRLRSSNQSQQVQVYQTTAYSLGPESAICFKYISHKCGRWNSKDTPQDSNPLVVQTLI